LDYINKLLYLLKSDLKLNLIEGYSERELNEVLPNSRDEIPKAYKEFLIAMGKYTPFLDGYHYSIEKLELMRESAFGLIKSHNKNLLLKEDDFVFLDGQGVAFAFFNLLERGNPPVYGFMEFQKSDKFTKLSDSFIDFMENLYENKNPINVIEIDLSL